MAKKIDLNRIIKKMNADFPNEDLSELEKARYLYVELGKLLEFDINYISSSERKSEDVYWRPVDFDRIDDNKYICRQIAEIYAELLKRVGINAKRHFRTMGQVIDEYFDSTGRHAYTVMKLSDGRKIIADLVYDLPFIQKGLETVSFGTSTENRDDIDLLDPAEVYEIDKKIKYMSQIDQKNLTYVYSNEFYRMVREEIENPEILKEYVDSTYPEEDRNDILARYKLDAISRFFELEKLGFREGKMFLKKLFQDFFTEEEKSKIKKCDLITEGERPHFYGETKMMQCFALDRGNGKYDYYMYITGNNLERMSKDKVKSLVLADCYSPLVKSEPIPGFDER